MPHAFVEKSIPAGIPFSLFSVMWSRSDIFGLFSINVGPFSSNLVLGGPLFSINLWARRFMVSGRYYVACFIFVHGPLVPPCIRQSQKRKSELR